MTCKSASRNKYFPSLRLGENIFPEVYNESLKIWTCDFTDGSHDIEMHPGNCS